MQSLSYWFYSRWACVEETSVQGDSARWFGELLGAQHRFLEPGALTCVGQLQGSGDTLLPFFGAKGSGQCHWDLYGDLAGRPMLLNRSPTDAVNMERSVNSGTHLLLGPRGPPGFPAFSVFLCSIYFSYLLSEAVHSALRLSRRSNCCLDTYMNIDFAHGRRQIQHPPALPPSRTS